MLSTRFISNYFPFILLLLAINSHGESLKLGTALFWFAIYFFTLFICWLIFYKYTNANSKVNLKIIYYYLIYVLCSSIWGMTLAKTYWDWKNLISNTMVLLIPITTYLVDNKYLFQRIIRYFMYVSTPLFFIIQFFINRDEFGFYLAPYTFILLFLPILPFKWKLFCLSISFYILIADFGARATALKFIFPILISFLFYFKSLINSKSIKFIRLVLLFIPFVFLILALANIFNIFNPQGDNSIEIIDKKKGQNGEIEYDNLLSDTRTFLYVEVLSTAKEYNSWFIGRSPALGNKSDVFGAADPNNRNERNSNEVGILNYFNWLGVIGVILIFIIYFQSSYLAVYKSNNIFSKLSGVYVAFRWIIAWVEDYNSFYISFIFLWLTIGFCYSENFRKMNDKEIKDWVVGIFKLKNLRQTNSRLY